MISSKPNSSSAFVAPVYIFKRLNIIKNIFSPVLNGTNIIYLSKGLFWDWLKSLVQICSFFIQIIDDDIDLLSMY